MRHPDPRDGDEKMQALVVLAIFVVLAILGPLIGTDSRVPGGWTNPTGDKIWPDPWRRPNRPAGTSMRRRLSRLCRSRWTFPGLPCGKETIVVIRIGGLISQSRQ